MIAVAAIFPQLLIWNVVLWLGVLPFPYDEKSALKAAQVHGCASAAFHMTNKRVIFTTAESIEQARTLANALIQRKLAACVNILPSMSSIYQWKGEVAEAEEFLILIKTTEAAFDHVFQTIRELHSYETPECIALPIDQGNPDYLKWIEESVK